MVCICDRIKMFRFWSRLIKSFSGRLKIHEIKESFYQNPEILQDETSLSIHFSFQWAARNSFNHYLLWRIRFRYSLSFVICILDYNSCSTANWVLITDVILVIHKKRIRFTFLIFIYLLPSSMQSLSKYYYISFFYTSNTYCLLTPVNLITCLDFTQTIPHF